MPANLAPPSQVPAYTGQVIPYGINGFNDIPKEGFKAIPISIKWGTDDFSGGVASGGVKFNFDAKQSEFQAIRSVYADMSTTGCPVALLFPDTQFKLRLSPGRIGTYPVFTKVREFYALTNPAQSSPANVTTPYTTFFQVMNFLAPPVSDVRSMFMFPTCVTAAIVSGTTVIINDTSITTLAGLVLEIENVLAGAGAAKVDISIQDANGVVLAATGFGVTNAQFISSAILFSSMDILVPIGGQLKIVMTVTGTALASGQINISTYTTSP